MKHILIIEDDRMGGADDYQKILRILIQNRGVTISRTDLVDHMI